MHADYFERIDRMKIGVQLFTLRETTQTAEDLATTLQRVKDIGYTTVQLSAQGKDISYDDMGRMLKDVGLSCDATHMGWPRFLEDLDGIIADHKAIDCKHAAIGGLPKEYATVDGLKKWLDELGPVAEKLAAEGMDFSYHNHDWEFMKMADGRVFYDALWADSSPEQLKAEVDTFWVTAGGGEPTDWLKRLAGRMPVVHFKDMCIEKTDAENPWSRERKMCPIGEGNLNWKGIIEACQAGGVEFAYVEQDQCYDREPFECVEASYKFLTSMGLS
jgi:sugar phosphate isomerase/epimerase